MKKIFYLLAFVFLLASCEYEPDGSNFNEIEPPDENIKSEILLNDYAPGETIYLYQGTKFLVNIDIAPQSVIELRITINGEAQYLISNSNIGEFTIYPFQFPEGDNQITLNAILASNTGSLANLMGYEAYAGELIWNLVVVYDFEKYSETGYRINENGFLEINWNNRFVPEKDITRYEISANTFLGNKIINDPYQKSFIDSSYVCDVGSYSIYYYGKKDYPILSDVIYIEAPVPILDFEEIDNKKLRIFWDKPFTNGSFELMHGDKVIYSGTDTTFIIDQFFGEPRYFYLTIRPLYQVENYYDNPKNTDRIYWMSGSATLSSYSYIRYAFNESENIIYLREYNVLRAINPSTLDEVGGKRFDDYATNFQQNLWNIATSPQNSTIAVLTVKNAQIFENKNLTTPLIIDELHGDGENFYDAFEITNNNRLFTIANNSNTCKIYDISSGKFLFSFDFSQNQDIGISNNISISEDGRYFSNSNTNGIEIFEIEESSAKILITNEYVYSKAIFVPNQPDKLLLKIGNNVEIRHLPDFSQVVQFNMPDTKLYNIDPATGNLLYYQDKNLKIAPLNDILNPSFTIDSDESQTTLFNNVLLKRYGLALNLKQHKTN